MNFKKLKRAFTLVEIIVAVAALGTLYSMSTANFNSYREMSINEQQKMNVQQVKNAVDNFYAKNNKYPTLPKAVLPNTKSPQPSKGSHMEVDTDQLVTDKYLQNTIKPPKNQYFVVDSNGVVTLEKNKGECVVIEGGQVVISSKTDATDTKKAVLNFDFYVDTAKKLNTIVVKGTNKDGTNCLYPSTQTSITLNSPTVPATGYITKKVDMNDVYGQKKFETVYTYDDGSTAKMESTIQYSIDVQSKNEDFYWKGPNWKETAPDKSNPIITATFTDAKNSDVVLDWTSQNVVTNIGVVNYEIRRFANGSSQYDSFYTNATTYTDSTAKSGVTYEYEVFAVNTKGNTTSNFVDAKGVIVTYTDHLANIVNITKNDYNAATNKEVTVQAFDYEGIKSVNLYTFNVVGNTMPSATTDFKTYTMYPTTTGIPNLDDKGNPILDSKGIKSTLTTYSVPIPVQDDYIVYFVEVVDNRGYSSYSYYNKNFATNKISATEDAILGSLPGTVILPTATEPLTDQCYTLMKGLREIYTNDFSDNTKIDTNSDGKYHLYDGKVTLP